MKKSGLLPVLLALLFVFTSCQAPGADLDLSYLDGMNKTISELQEQYELDPCSIQPEPATEGNPLSVYGTKPEDFYRKLGYTGEFPADFSQSPGIDGMRVLLAKPAKLCGRDAVVHFGYDTMMDWVRSLQFSVLLQNPKEEDFAYLAQVAHTIIDKYEWIAKDKLLKDTADKTAKSLQNWYDNNRTPHSFSGHFHSDIRLDSLSPLPEEAAGVAYEDTLRTYVSISRVLEDSVLLTVSFQLYYSP